MIGHNELSNAAYVTIPIVAALLGVSWLSVFALTFSWGGLAITSFMGHYRETRFWWHMDVVWMIMAVFSLGLLALSQFWAGIWIMLPAVGGVMYYFDPPTNKSVAVVGIYSFLALLILRPLFAFVPLGIFGLLTWLRVNVIEQEGPLHVLWHYGTALAGLSYVVILL